MATYALTVQEIDLLHQAAGMAGDRPARQENDAGARVMETLIAHLETRPASVWLNVAQREVLGKMLMNIAYDLIRRIRTPRPRPRKPWPNVCVRTSKTQKTSKEGRDEIRGCHS